jgi:hypothetical protein
MKHIIMLVTVALLMVATLAVASVRAEAAVTKTVRYGPFTIPAGSGEMPGEFETFKVRVAKPCKDCFITSFKPNLTYPDGTTANLDSGVMLHHAVFTSQFRSDPTCGSSETPVGAVGERFFGSGSERTAISFPSGYGYRVKWWDSWNLVVELMNHGDQSKSVYVDVTYTYRSANTPVNPLKPVWLDIDNCGDSEYSIAAGGHVHGHGIAVEATNESRGAHQSVDQRRLWIR